MSLPAWIPYQTAFRLIVSKLDPQTGDAYEKLHTLRRGVVRYAAAKVLEQDAAHQATDRAHGLLLAGLVSGEIEATGVHTGSMRSEPIAPDDWTRADPNSPLALNELGLPGAIIADVRVRRDDVVRAADVIGTSAETDAAPKRKQRVAEKDIVRRAQHHLTTLPKGSTNLRLHLEKFLQSNGYAGSARQKAGELLKNVTNKPKRGRPIKGFGNSAK